MASEIFRDLVDDALLVAKYGQRSGRFKDGTLFSAIQKVMADPNIDWGNQEAVELQTALNDAIQCIHPVTLIDLKKWNPYAPDKLTDANAARSSYYFVAFAIILIFICAYCTNTYKSAVSLIASNQTEKVTKQTAILNESIFPLLASEEKTLADLRNFNSALSIAVRARMEEAKEIENSINVDRQSLNTLIAQFNPWQQGYYWILNLFFSPPDTNTTSFESNLCSSVQKPATESKPADLQDEGDEKTLGELKRQIAISAKIRCAIGLQDSSSAIFNEYLLNAIKGETDFLGLWILPAIYGALGSLMYYMRSIMNPILPNPSISKVALRMSLGGFAGIAIAWFWSPPLSREIIVTDVTVGTLAIAFLVGFSIDIFFGLLDRLVTIAMNSISKLGTT